MAVDPFLSPPLEIDGSAWTGAGGLWASTGSHLAPTPLDVHVNPKFEVGIVLVGEEEIHFGSHVLVCRPGDVWLCGSWEPHGYRYSAPNTANAVVKFPLEFLGEELLGEMSWTVLFTVPPADRPRVNSPELRESVLQIGYLLRREIQLGRPRWEGMVRLGLLQLFVELSRQWTEWSPSGAFGCAGASDFAAIMPAMNLVYSLPWRRVTLPQAAAACSSSVSRFRARFTRTMGMGFGDFCLQARLSLVAQRLLRTSRTVAAIATEAGFTDAAHLRRHFCKRYGSAPAEYRKQFGRPRA
jgi:AraC-like DNA-binding protein